MHTINIIEVDFDGKIHPQREFTLGFLPRINEKIILNDLEGIPQVFKILDVHHIPGDRTKVYLTHENTLKSIHTSLIHQAGL